MRATTARAPRCRKRLRALRRTPVFWICVPGRSRSPLCGLPVRSPASDLLSIVKSRFNIPVPFVKGEKWAWRMHWRTNVLFMDSAPAGGHADTAIEVGGKPGSSVTLTQGMSTLARDGVPRAGLLAVAEAAMGARAHAGSIAHAVQTPA